MAEALNKVSSSINSGINKVMSKGDMNEGETTKMIENQTAKIPSVTFLNLAIGSMALSLGLAVFGSRSEQTRPYANFVGLWAPTFLLLGIYNKIVKIEGNDRFSRT